MSWSTELLRECPPSDRGAERYVLGCVIFEPDCMQRIAHLLEVKDFYHDSNGVIWGACADLFATCKPIDALSVADAVRAGGKMAGEPIATCLHEMSDGIASTANLEHHVASIAEKSRARQLIHTSMDIISRSLAGRSVSETANTFSDQMQVLATSNGSGLKMDPWSLPELLEQPDQTPDWIVEPLFSRGDLVIIQADSGVGKTWFALDMMLHAASGREFLGRFQTTPTRWLYCDFDMHADGHIIRGRLKRLARCTDLQYAETCQIMTRKHLPSAINLSTGEGISIICKTIEANKIDVVVFEVFATIHGGRDENKAADMDHAMSALRQISSSTGAAVILPHHTRKRQQGETDNPTDSGRGSSAIKARADCVIDLRVKAKNQYADEESTSAPIIISHVKARHVKQLRDFKIHIEDDTILEGTRLIYDGENLSDGAKLSDVKTWILSEFFPGLESQGLTTIWQQDLLKTISNEKLCSDRTARIAIREMEKDDILKMSWKRDPGSSARKKMLQVEAGGRGGK